MKTTDYVSLSLPVLTKLLQIPSVETEALPGMPFGKANADALQYSLAVMAELGFATKKLENYCGYGEIGTGDLFGVLCHLDVVPAGEGWDYPPFGAEQHNGRIYARGAEDDKGPFVAALFAAKRLLDEGRTPTKRLRFILGCDEESGWLCMNHYMKTEELPALGFSPDGDFPVIHCEKGVVYHHFSFPLPSGVHNITAGTRPNVVPNQASAVLDADRLVASLAKSQGIAVTMQNDGTMRLDATGISAHGSHPEQGDNALIKLLGALGIKYPIFNRFYAAFSEHNGAGADLALADAESGALTLNLGTCKTEQTMVHFSLDIRYPIRFDKDNITATLSGLFADVNVAQGDFHLPLYHDPNSPLIQALLASYQAVTGDFSPPLAVGGATYARVLPQGVAFGPCFPGETSSIHQKNENISLVNYERLIDIYYEALKRLCFS